MLTVEFIETAIIAFTTFFATIGPIDTATLFAALTANASARQKHSMALRGILIGGFLLFAFALFGEDLLARLGISLYALRTAGGILLLLIGIDMVFARHSGGHSTTADENVEASSKTDIAVFPLATPLIAGPGAMGAAILLMATAGEQREQQIAVLSGLVAILLLTYILLIIATYIQKLLGVTGMQVISRVFGVLLSALAVQFIFDGIAASPLIGVG